MALLVFRRSQIRRQARGSPVRKVVAHVEQTAAGRAQVLAVVEQEVLPAALVSALEVGGHLGSVVVLFFGELFSGCQTRVSHPRSAEDEMLLYRTPALVGDSREDLECRQVSAGGRNG